MLFENEKIVYVGQTKNLYNRIYQHSRHSDNILFTHFEMLEVEESATNDLEAELIVKYQTKHNLTLPTNSKYYSEPMFLKKLVEIYPQLTVKDADKILKLEFLQPVFTARYKYYNLETACKKIDEIKGILGKAKG